MSGFPPNGDKYTEIQKPEENREEKMAAAGALEQFACFLGEKWWDTLF